MGLLSSLSSLVRSVTGTHFHHPEFVNLVNMVASSLRYQIQWDDENSNMCAMEVPVNGESYFFFMSLTGINVSLTVSSHIPITSLPRDIGGKLAERNRELPWGDWKVGSRRCYVSASMRVRNVHEEPISEAIRAMVGEVAHFDHCAREQGYA